jgi:hypothetical protein
MEKHVLVVLSNSVEGADDQFNNWYTNTHLGDVLNVPGFVAAQRYKLSGTQLGDGATPYGYLALYEVETDDLAATGAGLTGNSDMYIDPALDRAATVAWFFTPITARVEAAQPAATR